MTIEDNDQTAGSPSQNSITPAKQVKSKTRARKSAPTEEAASAAVPEKATRKKYTHAERTKLLASISKDLSNSDVTVKTALQKVGISEQTYYNWKKDSATKVQNEPVQQSDELKALVELEAENQRLRKALAEKLRSENAELRKRLGL